jgi:hypothetical protein
MKKKVPSRPLSVDEKGEQRVTVAIAGGWQVGQKRIEFAP